MEKITNLNELHAYLDENISVANLFTKENEQDAHSNFQRGFESGYSNAYANLMALIDEEFAKEWTARNENYGKTTE